MKHIDAKEFNKEDVLHNVELLFSPVEKLGLPENLLDRLCQKHIWIIIQLCIVPQVRGICKKETELIQKQLSKKNLGLGIIQADNIMLDEYCYGRNEVKLSSLIKNFVSEINSSIRYAEKLPLPGMTDEEYQASIKQAKKDEKKGFLFSRNKRILLHAPLGDLEQYVVPRCVAEIADKAFYKRTRLKKIVIPDSVIKIGTHAFDGCIHLKKIKITEKTKEIGLNAFYNVPAAAKLPESILSKKMIADGIKAVKRWDDEALIDEKIKRAKPSKLIKVIEYLKERYMAIQGLPDLPDLPTPSRNELDDRLKALFDAPVPIYAMSACCYSPAPPPDPISAVISRLKHQQKLRFRCPQCGRYTVADVDPEHENVKVLSHASDFLDFAQYFRTLGLDTCVTGYGICKFCSKKGSQRNAGLFWKVSHNGKKHRFELYHSNYLLFQSFLSAVSELDYSHILQVHPSGIGSLLACLGYIKPDDSFCFEFDDELEESK